MGRKPKFLIEAGGVYEGRGNRIRRVIVAIGDEHRPKTYAGRVLTGAKNEWSPNEPGVLYEEDGKLNSLFLSVFKGWAKFRIS